MTLDDSITSLNLTKRAIVTLQSVGISTISDLTAITKKELLSIPALGKRTANYIEQALADEKLSLNDSSKTEFTEGKIMDDKEPTNISDAINILEAISLGCDPSTGELLDNSNILRRTDIHTALNTVLEAINLVAKTFSQDKKSITHNDAPLSGDSDINVYEAVEEKYGIKATGGPARFNKPGWFYIGSSVVDCPECAELMEAFRKPYTTKAGLKYHYWALVCTECACLYEPRELGEKRQDLYASSEHRPSSQDEME